MFARSQIGSSVGQISFQQTAVKMEAKMSRMVSTKQGGSRYLNFLHGRRGISGLNMGKWEFLAFAKSE